MKKSNNKLKVSLTAQGWAIALSSSAFAIVTLGEVFTGGSLIFLPLGIVSAVTAGAMFQNLENLKK